MRTKGKDVSPLRSQPKQTSTPKKSFRPFASQLINQTSNSDLQQANKLSGKELELLQSENTNLRTRQEIEELQAKIERKSSKIKQAEDMLYIEEHDNSQWANKHFSETITFMEKENEELKAMISALESGQPPSSDSQLIGLINNSDELLIKLQKEYESEKKRNEVLEQMHTDWKNIDSIRAERDSYKVKWAELVSAIQKLSKGTISKLEFESLNNQVNEMEMLQQRLITENDKLKAEIITEQRSNIEKQRQIHNMKSAGKDLKLLRLSIDQFWRVVTDIKSGSNVDISNVLAAVEPRIGGADEVVLEEVIEELKVSFQALRDATTDLYAMHCGSRCDVQ